MAKQLMDPKGLETQMPAGPCAVDNSEDGSWIEQWGPEHSCPVSRGHCLTCRDVGSIMPAHLVFKENWEIWTFLMNWPDFQTPAIQPRDLGTATCKELTAANPQPPLPSNLPLLAAAFKQVQPAQGHQRKRGP